MAVDRELLKRYGMYLVGVAWLIEQWRKNTSLTRKGVISKDAAKQGGKVIRDRNYQHFGRDLRYLLKVCFSKPSSKESMLFYSFVTVLLLRTFLSLAVADIDGYLVKQLINKDKKQVVAALAMWLGIALPSSFSNALIKYLQSRLALALRTRLSEHARDKYFRDETFFRISHLDKTVPNPEHALTEDIAQWAERLSELLSSLGKPLVDLTFFSTMLFKTLGFVNQFAASVVVWESGNFLKRLRPNYADMVTEKGSLEAGLRFQHTRVIAASEEIAFCRGERREKEMLETYFQKIVAFTKRSLRSQIFYHTFEDFMTKYVWTAIGLVQVAVPLLQRGGEAGDNAKYFITVKRMMLRTADATERLLVGIKDVTEFSGYTRRVMDMLRAFDKAAADQRAAAEAAAAVVVHSVAGSGDVTSPLTAAAAAADGRVVMRDVPIVTPTGETLLPKVNLELMPGDRLLILGPNGCGKSSIFRVLCNLWPVSPGSGGRIVKPMGRNDLFFLPQRPYMVQGTFRDQIIYPHTREQMTCGDEQLLAILDDVLLRSVCDAHGGLDAVKEWTEVLSGGEKQRLGLSRVFYHRPKFAILDECSSAINVEAELHIFERLVATGMGLITISHRQTLFRFHTKLLTLDGEGGYEFDDALRTGELDTLHARKQKLMGDLNIVLRELGEAWPQSLHQALGQP